MSPAKHQSHPDPGQNAELLARVAARFRPLSDESRLRIMLRLRAGECSVGVLAADLGVNQPSASKHLAILRHAGLVDVRREGASSIFFCRDSSIYDMCEIVCDGVMRQLEKEFAALGMGGGA